MYGVPYRGGMISKEIGKLFKRGRKKGRKRGKKEEKEEKRRGKQGEEEEKKRQEIKVWWAKKREMESKKGDFVVTIRVSFFKSGMGRLEK